MKQIKDDLILLLSDLLSSSSYNINIRKLKSINELHLYSIFSYLPYDNKLNILNYYDYSSNRQIKRCVGSLCGLAIADSIGHNFEFLPVQDYIGLNGSYLEYPSSIPGGKIHQPLNQFRLKPGQWTDDTSMALCQADSLLVCGGFNGSHMRCYFWNWWNNNVNNAFRYDESRSNSCGLGGNISQSLGDVSNRSELPNFVIPHKYGSFNEDSGNGSLMRLAPIPIRFHSNLQKAREAAYLSSLTTHPGTIAAEACSFVSYLIVKCIHRKSPITNNSTPSPKSPLNQQQQQQQQSLKSSFFSSFLSSSSSSTSPHSPSPPSVNTVEQVVSNESDGQLIQEFLDKVIEEYITLRDGESTTDSEESIGWKSLKNVLIGRDNPPTERCWNWRLDTLDFETTLNARGRRYNGYPVSPTYFGAYSLDGLAMALHALYHNTSFNMTIVKVVNMCGDADSTGAICGQIAGAYYGIDEIDRIWLRDLRRWDPEREIELRAILLYSAGILCDLPDQSTSQNVNNPSSSISSTSTSLPTTTTTTTTTNGSETNSTTNPDVETKIVDEKKSSNVNEMQVQDDFESDLNCTELHLSSFFPEPDTKPVVGFRHPEYQEPPQPSRSFDNPYTVTSKRKRSIFRLFS